MQFHLSTAEIFIPDGLPAEQALSAHHSPGDQRTPGRYRNNGN